MATTEQHLIRTLDRLGYKVTKRRLTDWRERGIMPPLCSAGQGRGKGRCYFWSEPDVLKHAITVCELLAYYRRVDDIYLPLWLLGFGVPLEVVRRKIMEWYGGLMQSLAGLTEEEAEDVCDKMAMSDLQWSDLPDLGGNQHHIIIAGSTLVATMMRSLSPCHMPTVSDLEELTSSLDQSARALELYEQRSSLQTIFSQDPEMLRAWVKFIEENCQPQQVQQMLLEVDDAILMRCQSDLRMLLNLFSAIARLNGLGVALHDLRIKLVPLTVCLLFGDLLARHSGFGGAIDEFVRSASDLMQRGLEDLTIATEGRSPMTE